MNWLSKLIYVVLFEIMQGILKFFSSIIDNIFDVMYSIQSIEMLKNVRDYTSGIAISLVSVYAIKLAIDTYVLQNMDNKDNDPLDILVRLSETVATILCGGYIIDKLISMAGVLATEITSKQLKAETTITKRLLNMMVSSTTVSGFILLGMLIAMIVSFILFVIKAGKRGAELILFQIMLPIIAISKMSLDRDMWKTFCNELVICIFGYIVQVFCMNEFTRILGNYPSILGGVGDILAALGWMLISLSAPKWLEKFISHSGVGSGAKQAGTMVLQSTIYKLHK